MKALPGEHEEVTKEERNKMTRGTKKTRIPYTFKPQLPISPYDKGSEEQEDKGTRRPETQDDQGNKKKGTMLFG